MSRQRKTAAVLRLLRGEDLETVSRALGVTTVLRRVRQGDRPRSGRAARPWIAIHVAPLPDGDRLPRHRESARLRPGARGQWLRRAVHPPYARYRLASGRHCSYSSQYFMERILEIRRVIPT